MKNKTIPHMLVERIKTNLDYLERNIKLIVDEDVAEKLKACFDVFVKQYNQMIVGEHEALDNAKIHSLDAEINHYLKISSQTVIETKYNYKRLLLDAIERLKECRKETKNIFERLTFTTLITVMNTRYRDTVVDGNFFPTKDDFEELDNIFPDSRNVIQQRIDKAAEQSIAIGGLANVSGKLSSGLVDLLNDAEKTGLRIEGKARYGTETSVVEMTKGVGSNPLVENHEELSGLVQILNNNTCGKEERLQGLFSRAAGKLYLVDEDNKVNIAGFVKGFRYNVDNANLAIFGLGEFKNWPLFYVETKRDCFYAMIDNNGKVSGNYGDNIEVFEPLLNAVINTL